MIKAHTENKTAARCAGKMRKSLKVSFLDGIFASCMLGMTADYITPYALFLKARVFQIGILNALPSLIGSLAQLKSADITEKVGSRKKVINTAVFLHLLMGLPIVFLPFLFKGYEVIALIIFVTLFTAFNAFAGPAWLSLMSDHLPCTKRGSYFGWRNKIFGIVITSSVFLAGFILHIFKADILKGFMVIFSIAFVSRFISWCFLIQMYEPSLKIVKDSYFNFFDFISRARESNFTKFVIFIASLNFAVNLAAPFFSVYMLRDLKFNYITYTILVTTVAITSIFTIDRWGRNADKIGNMRVLRFTSIFIAIIPFLWVLNAHPVYIFLVQIISGFAWSGFNLCAINFIHDATSPQKRTRCIAYFNVFAGTALCLGSLTGGYLANRLPELFGYKILTLVLLSGVLRLLIVFIFSCKIKEVRSVQHITDKDLFFSVVGVRPVLGVK